MASFVPVQHRNVPVKLTNACFLIAIAGCFAANTAYAGPQTFGPATATLVSTDVPTVNLANDTITLNGGSAGLTGGTGVLSGLSPTGSGSGVFDFSPAVGAVAQSSVLSLFTFTSGSNTITFDLSSAETIVYNVPPGSASTIQLYLLGDIYSSNPNPSLDTAASSASILLTLSSDGVFPYSESGALAAPLDTSVTADVPEPASILVLSIGVAGMAVVQSLRKRRA